MVDYQLLYPPSIAFGWGCRETLGDVVVSACGTASPCVLLVCTRTAVRTGVADEVGGLCPGQVGAVCSEVPHDPALATVDELIGQARAVSADAIVAVGGGSVIDAAKAAAVIAPTGGAVTPFHRGARTVDRPGLPLIALPTTAGTGAEITKNAVLTDPDAGVKKSLRSPFMVPRAAIVDPELTVSMPPSLTAASGLDALTQAIESYVSLRANSVSRALAARAVGMLMAALPKAYECGTDAAARTATAEGSLLSAMAFSQSGLGAAHGLAHPLGLALDLAHGITCAVLLPHVLEWNAPVCAAELGELAAASGCGCGAGFVNRVKALCCELGVPGDFCGFGLRPEHSDQIVANCRSGSMSANPRAMSDDDVRALLMRLSGDACCGMRGA